MRLPSFSTFCYHHFGQPKYKGVREYCLSAESLNPWFLPFPHTGEMNALCNIQPKCLRSHVDCRHSSCLDLKLYNISILHDIFLAFGTNQTFFTRNTFRTGLYQIFPKDNLGFNKLIFKISVNGRASNRCS